MVRKGSRKQQPKTELEQVPRLFQIDFNQVGIDCHQSARAAFLAWQQVKKQSLAPIHAQEMLQESEPIPVVQPAQKDRLELGYEFVGGFYSINQCLTQTQSYEPYDNKARSRPIWVLLYPSMDSSVIERRAWLELIHLAHRPLDTETGWASWQQTINSSMPTTFIHQFLNCSELSKSWVCSYANLTRRQLDYQRTKLKKQSKEVGILNSKNLIQEAADVAKHAKTN